ncbi:MAG: N-acetylglucosamine-6-phosphate deacetylase [Erysipelotrichaceae bacterium]|nr:N-acetylglucosamine-6-phosphate deacetylase [Erysipelotrichaceae bacterium]
MAYTIIKAKRIIDGEGLDIHEGYLVLKDGLIEKVADMDDGEVKSLFAQEDTEIIIEDEMTIVPGMLDIHTHGAMGVDFIDVDEEKLKIVGQRYLKEGVTGFCTSTMVLVREKEKELLKKFGSLPQITAPRWLGVHLEGPHMNEKYHAMMDPRYLRKPSVEELLENVELTNHRLLMITMAPELEGAKEFIEACVENKVAVMLAHSNATSKQTAEALTWGASGFTHLYNAMSQHTHRNPGMVTAALLDENTFKELIVDGYHIDEDVIKLTYKILGKEQIILVTDAMPGKGLGDGEYEFGKLPCVIKDNKAFEKASGRIAGSTLGMNDAMRNIMKFTGCSVSDAVVMACVNPAKLLKLDKKLGSLSKGKAADFVLVDDDLNVFATFIDANCVYRKSDE